jgi:hypothetical protein
MTIRTITTLLLVGIVLTAASPAALPAHTVFIEAEGFQWTGGWVVDQQFMDQMDSVFRVWVRTRDWVALRKAPGAPGKFQLLVNGKALETTFGTEGEQWHWQDGGSIDLRKGKAELALHDLSGFEGRCDAILLTTDTNLRPPDGGAALALFRRQALGLPDTPPDAGTFDLVVVGGGIAGTATAVSAARLGLKVALIQDRPVLGGNNSSEIRVHLGGKIHLPPYPALGAIVDELDPRSGGNARPARNYDDEKKLAVVKAEKNVRLFLNSRAVRVEKSGSRIAAVVSVDVLTGRELRYTAPLFADCTGDFHNVVLRGRGQARGFPRDSLGTAVQRTDCAERH